MCLSGEGGGTPLGCAIADLPPCSFHVDPIRGQLPHHLLQARLGRYQWRQPRPGAVCPEGCCGCKRLWCVGAPTACRLRGQQPIPADPDHKCTSV